MAELLAIVTIGRTGAEAITSELAQHPLAAILPGQNFSGSDGVLYRPHNYHGRPAGEIFDQLVQHCYGRIEGHAWLGLSKYMSGDELARYMQSGHRERFIAGWRGSPGFLDVAEDFTRSYFDAMGIDHSGARYIGFFSNNLPVWLAPEDLNSHPARFLDWTASPALWVALICENLTWNPASALKFWIISRLCFRSFAREWPERVVSASMDDYLDDPGQTVLKVTAALGLPPLNAADRRELPAGHIRINRERLMGLKDVANDMRDVLHGHSLFRLAQAFPSWADRFLDDPEGRDLISKYRGYWASTSHIAFDLSSPIEDKIIDKAAGMAGVQDEYNLSFDVFHRQIAMNSRNFSNPQASYYQSLGILEDELVIPCAPYYLRACVAYLNAVLDSYIYDPWTFLDLRRNRLYLRLKAEPYASAFKRFGLDDLRTGLESRIDETARHIAGTHAADRRLRVFSTHPSKGKQ